MASVGASLSGNFHQTQGQRLLDIAAPPALVEQLAGALATAGRATPLANEGDWLGMTAWLVRPRARRLLPTETQAQAEAVADFGRLQNRLEALHEVQNLARRRAARPRCVCPRRAGMASDHSATPRQVDLVGCLWASTGPFAEAGREVDAAIVDRPPWHDLYGPLQARQRILAMLALLPGGASFEWFRPPFDAENNRSGCLGLHWRGKGMLPWSRRQCSCRSICGPWLPAPW